MCLYKAATIGCEGKKSPFFLNYLSENRDFIDKKSLPLILYVFILEKSF